MRYPSILISALTAIAVALSAQAEEVLTPPITLQHAPIPKRVIITPAPKSAPKPDSSVKPTSPANGVAVLDSVRSLDFSTAIVQPPVQKSQKRVIVQPPGLLSDTDIDPTLESAETLLGVHSIGTPSAATNCQLDTQRLMTLPDQLDQAATGLCSCADLVAHLLVPESNNQNDFCR